MPLFATLFTSKLRGSDRAVQQLRQNSARDNDWPGRRGAIPGGGGGMVSGIVRSNTRTRMATIEPVDNSDPLEVHSKDLGVLQKRMQKSQADMRSQFADIGSIKDQLFFDDVRLAVGIDEAKAANKGLSKFREEMEGDFELMNHKAAWTAAYDAVLAAALGEDPNVKPTTANLSAFICEQLAKAEPDVKPYASSFVGRHPLDHATLKVFHATEASMLSDGTTLRVRDGVETPDEVAGPVAVFVTGEAELSNPHGLKKDSEKGTSIAPLKSMSGDTFAVLVSGPPAVPDEFLESLARHAGPLLERVWKKEQVHCMVGNVMEFIKSFALSMSAMLRVTYEPDATVDFTPVIGDDSYVWKWQSFEYTDPNDPSSFVVCLAWRLGEPVGLLRVSCGTFTEMNEQIVTLLHTIAVVLQETVAEIETLSPGVVPPLISPREVMMAYEAKRWQAPVLLEAEIQAQLQWFDYNKIFAELRAMDEKAINEKVLSLVQGAFCLMGYCRKSVDKWHQIRVLLKNPRKLRDQMVALPLSAENMIEAEQAKWDNLMMATKKLDFAEIEKHGSAPTKMLLRWVNAVELTHNIALAIEKEKLEDQPTPIANQVFDSIDVDKDGYIDVKELVNYMIREFSSAAAHRMVRVLDADNDHKISRAEWHRGWNTGMMAEVLEKVKLEKQAASDDQARLRKRRGDALQLGVGIAAAQYEAAQAAAAAKKNSRYSSSKGSSKELGSSSGSSKKNMAEPGSSGKLKLKPIEKQPSGKSKK